MKAAFAGTVALDDYVRTDHPFLTAADHCRCLAEYLPGRGYRASHVNQLIVNLKCPPSIASADPHRMHYKLRAIDAIARALRGALSQSLVESATWIPIPSSRRRSMQTMTIDCIEFWRRPSATTTSICGACSIRANARRRTMPVRSD
jgi:hypothetical protein